MLGRYEMWIYAWETRLTERDKNRVVSPLDWGLEWTVLPRFSRTTIAESVRLKLDPKVGVLPGGHSTSGETPFKFLDA